MVACEVCSREGLLELYHGYWIHPDCAPSYWRDDRERHETFMAKVRALFDRPGVKLAIVALCLIAGALVDGSIR